MAQRQRIEESFSEKARRWFRRNEKIFWVALLVLVCFSFGATFIMARVLGDPFRKTCFWVDGVGYSFRDVQYLGKRLALISGMPGGINYLSLVSNPFSKEEKETLYQVIAKVLAADCEARKLGIFVPNTEVMKVTRRCFKEEATWQKLGEQTKFMTPEEREKYRKENLDSIRKSIQWDPQKYFAWITEKGLSARTFENTIEMLLRIQALRDLFVESGSITRKELFQNFVRERRKLKLAIAEIPFSRFEEEVQKEISESELEKYWREHTEKFTEPERISFEYLLFPESHFKTKVKITEADLRQRYEQTKQMKYAKNQLVPQPELVFPLTPQEQREYEKLQKNLYKPFEEVKDEIRKELIQERTRNLAASFATNLVKKVQKAKEAAEKGEKAATPREIAKDYNFVKYGTTEPFTEENAKEKLKYLYFEGRIKSWFKQLREGKELTLPVSYLLAKDEEGATYYVIVTSVKSFPAQTLTWENDREKCMEIARREIAAEKTRKKAEEKAQELIVKVREGKKLTEVAKDFNVILTDPLGRTDRGKIELKEGSKLPPEIEAQVFSNFFGTLALEERVIPTALEDKKGKRFFVCAIQSIVDQPDPSEFTVEVENQLRRMAEFRNRWRRLGTEWPDYLRTLVARYVVLSKWGKRYFTSL